MLHYFNTKYRHPFLSTSTGWTNEIRLQISLFSAYRKRWSGTAGQRGQESPYLLSHAPKPYIPPHSALCGWKFCRSLECNTGACILFSERKVGEVQVASQLGWGWDGGWVLLPLPVHPGFFSMGFRICFIPIWNVHLGHALGKWAFLSMNIAPVLYSGH